MATRPSRTQKVQLTREQKNAIMKRRISEMSDYEKAVTIRVRISKNQKHYITSNQIKEFDAIKVAAKYPMTFRTEGKNIFLQPLVLYK